MKKKKKKAEGDNNKSMKRECRQWMNRVQKTPSRGGAMEELHTGFLKRAVLRWKSYKQDS